MELASTTAAPTNKNSAERRSSETVSVPRGTIVQSSHFKTLPERNTPALTHIVASAASEPTQASSAGLRRSGTTIPASAPAPQSAKTEASSHSSAPMEAFSTAAAPGAYQIASGHRQQGKHDQQSQKCIGHVSVDAPVMHRRQTAREQQRRRSDRLEHQSVHQMHVLLFAADRHAEMLRHRLARVLHRRRTEDRVEDHPHRI